MITLTVTPDTLFESLSFKRCLAKDALIINHGC